MQSSWLIFIYVFVLAPTILCKELLWSRKGFSSRGLSLILDEEDVPCQHLKQGLFQVAQQEHTLFQLDAASLQTKYEASIYHTNPQLIPFHNYTVDLAHIDRISALPTGLWLHINHHNTTLFSRAHPQEAATYSRQALILTTKDVMPKYMPMAMSSISPAPPPLPRAYTRSLLSCLSAYMGNYPDQPDTNFVSRPALRISSNNSNNNNKHIAIVSNNAKDNNVVNQYGYNDMKSVGFQVTVVGVYEGDVMRCVAAPFHPITSLSKFWRAKALIGPSPYNDNNEHRSDHGGGKGVYAQEVISNRLEQVLRFDHISPPSSPSSLSVKYFVTCTSAVGADISQSSSIVHTSPPFITVTFPARSNDGYNDNTGDKGGGSDGTVIDGTPTVALQVSTHSQTKDGDSDNDNSEDTDDESEEEEKNQDDDEENTIEEESIEIQSEEEDRHESTGLFKLHMIYDGFVVRTRAAPGSLIRCVATRTQRTPLPTLRERRQFGFTPPASASADADADAEAEAEAEGGKAKVKDVDFEDYEKRVKRALRVEDPSELGRKTFWSQYPFGREVKSDDDSDDGEGDSGDDNEVKAYGESGKYADAMVPIKSKHKGKDAEQEEEDEDGEDGEDGEDEEEAGGKYAGEKVRIRFTDLYDGVYFVYCAVSTGTLEETERDPYTYASNIEATAPSTIRIAFGVHNPPVLYHPAPLTRPSYPTLNPALGLSPQSSGVSTVTPDLAVRLIGLPGELMRCVAYRTAQYPSDNVRDDSMPGKARSVTPGLDMTVDAQHTGQQSSAEGREEEMNAKTSVNRVKETEGERDRNRGNAFDDADYSMLAHLPRSGLIQIDRGHNRDNGDSDDTETNEGSESDSDSDADRNSDDSDGSSGDTDNNMDTENEDTTDTDNDDDNDDTASSFIETKSTSTTSDKNSYVHQNHSIINASNESSSSKNEASYGNTNAAVDIDAMISKLLGPAFAPIPTIPNTQHHDRDTNTNTNDYINSNRNIHSKANSDASAYANANAQTQSTIDVDGMDVGDLYSSLLASSASMRKLQMYEGGDAGGGESADDDDNDDKDSDDGDADGDDDDHDDDEDNGNHDEDSTSGGDDVSGLTGEALQDKITEFLSKQQEEMKEFLSEFKNHHPAGTSNDNSPGAGSGDPGEGGLAAPALVDPLHIATKPEFWAISSDLPNVDERISTGRPQVMVRISAYV